jgi:hypothetical protein
MRVLPSFRRSVAFHRSGHYSGARAGDQGSPQAGPHPAGCSDPGPARLMVPAGCGANPAYRPLRAADWASRVASLLARWEATSARRWSPSQSRNRNSGVTRTGETGMFVDAVARAALRFPPSEKRSPWMRRIRWMSYAGGTVTAVVLGEHKVYALDGPVSTPGAFGRVFLMLYRDVVACRDWSRRTRNSRRCGDRSRCRRGRRRRVRHRTGRRRGPARRGGVRVAARNGRRRLQDRARVVPVALALRIPARQRAGQIPTVRRLPVRRRTRPGRPAAEPGQETGDHRAPPAAAR